MIKPTLAAVAGRISSGRPRDRLGTLSVSQTKTEILSGLTVALALVPEAVAFAFVAGVHPLVGLYAAFIVGLVTALLGGRPGMISGATGALAVVMVSLVSQHGVEYLFATVVVMGVLQVLAGIFHLGKFIRLVPHPVMLGFVNGLAIVIFLAQLSQFQVPGSAEGAGGHGMANGQWLTGLPLATMLGLVALTMAIIWAMPRLTRAVPAPLAGIGVVAGLVIVFGIDVPRVGDMASIEGSLPAFHIPMVPLTLETLRIVLPYAFILAAIGLIESLLTLNLVGEITGQRGGASKECVAQGTANVVTGFFGGMGGCAMIGQSLINIKSGGRGRTSGVVAALALAIFIMIGGPVIGQIPVAALVGVMFMVVIGTFEWATFKTFGRVPASEVFVILAVTLITVFLHNLALAVLVGVILSALVFAWESAKHVRLLPADQADGTRVYYLHGLLFFGSVREFSERLAPAKDPAEVIIDFKEAKVCDYSSLEMLSVLTERYKKAGKRVRLRHLSPECRQLLQEASALVEIEVAEDDPHYTLARI